MGTSAGPVPCDASRNCLAQRTIMAARVKIFPSSLVPVEPACRTSPNCVTNLVEIDNRMDMKKCQCRTGCRRRNCRGAKLRLAKAPGNFNFEVVASNCYAAAMSRKSSSDSHNGFADVIGVALLLLVALP